MYSSTANFMTLRENPSLIYRAHVCAKTGSILSQIHRLWHSSWLQQPALSWSQMTYSWGNLHFPLLHHLLKLHYQKSWYAYYIILKTAFNTVYTVEIKNKMSAISDSLKPFIPRDNYLIISINRSHSFISSVLKTDNLPKLTFSDGQQLIEGFLEAPPQT